MKITLVNIIFLCLGIAIIVLDVKYYNKLHSKLMKNDQYKQNFNSYISKKAAEELKQKEEAERRKEETERRKEISESSSSYQTRGWSEWCDPKTGEVLSRDSFGSFVNSKGEMVSSPQQEYREYSGWYDFRTGEKLLRNADGKVVNSKGEEVSSAWWD